MKNDGDGGAAYANRVITLAALFLGVVTVLLVVAAPVLMPLLLSNEFNGPELADQRQSVIDFARFCLPQVFFYGMFVLVGQVLNSRGKFGPMMWAPIANNVISVLVLVIYLVVFGQASESELYAAFSPGEEALLGIGSTLGIAVQFLVLLPFLRQAGFKFAPRFDFRDSGLGHTFRLGLWTLLFVAVNQAAYLVVVRLASSGPASGGPGAEGTGYTVYSSSFLIMMVPHAVLTVSLATALLPTLSRYAAEDDMRSLGGSLSRTLRTALAVIVPFVGLFPIVAGDAARILFSWGAGDGFSRLFVPTLVLFAPGLFFFTIHYFMLRGFYALEQTRTVFFIQVVIAAVNIVMAVLLVRNAAPHSTAPALAIAYGCAYAVGSAISYAVLRRTTGNLESRELVRFLVRIALATAGGVAVAWLVQFGLNEITPEASKPWSLVRIAVAGGLGTATILLLARLMRVRELNALLTTVTSRLRRA